MPPLNSNTPPSLHRIASPKSLTSHNGSILRFTALDYSLPSHPVAETSKDSLPALQGICLLNGDYSIFSPMTLIELIGFDQVIGDEKLSSLRNIWEIFQLHYSFLRS
ncbi:hypothetical protein F2Q69_00010217 [Brassica cretica]|uniref:Uncharacterized protein n=1 Tax=Brassica cretica TaxID=69181 RepID=A0A8S9R3X5_BRACR|nr:hypothetical protein F2Q69_00010217 [Brassica cretica]